MKIRPSARAGAARFSRPAFDTVLPGVDGIVRRLRPSVPLLCLRPATLEAAAQAFSRAFSGRVLYAVKCNPDPAVLKGLARGGVRDWDAASLAEVRLVRGLFPDARIHFMHPVKSRPAIAEAWSRHGVRDFVVDSEAELAKILDETGAGGELGLVVRLALPKGGAVHDLSAKFGAEPALAAALLRLARPKARRLGLSFHVGSQCLDPSAWEKAIALAARVAAEAGVRLDLLDVGGGFPVAYPGTVPPPLCAFMDAIHEGFRRHFAAGATELWCEPGRALAAPAQSVVVQVLARRGRQLFINDGIYGTLSDAGIYRFRYPCRPIAGDGRILIRSEEEFSFFGPTCDSADAMAGPFLLPGDVAEGDWIEIGQIGAYGASLRTGFNGFGEVLTAETGDPPLIETPGLAPVHRRAA